VLVNCLSHPWHGAFVLPEEWADAGVADAAGNPLPAQAENGRTVVLLDLPGANFATIRRHGRATPAAPPPNAAMVLENDLIRYTFADNGELLGAFDKEANREALADDACGNRLSLYVDRPTQWDAWDIDQTYEDEWLEDARAVSKPEFLPGGAVRQGLRFRLAIGESRLEQTVFLTAGTKRLDFVTTADWVERHRMLRVSFPVAVAANEASFEIQYGYVRRPTHRNTSWDMARFEVAAQRYADLSAPDYGVALLNNCKYGHKVLGNVLDLNLLRASTHPDPIADRGHHEFTYALLPHCGDLVNSTVMAEAAMLNQPPVCFPGRATGKVSVPCRVSKSAGVSLEVLKRGEKEDCRIIRLVETRGCTSSATLELTAVTALIETNLLEWTEGERLNVVDGAVQITLRPFEIRTYKLVE